MQSKVKQVEARVDLCLAHTLDSSLHTDVIKHEARCYDACAYATFHECDHELYFMMEVHTDT